VDQDTQDALVERFGELHRGLPMSPHIRLEFRHSEILGPNAFALPGGVIVMTDQLVELAGSEEEILAVLAHEIGHVEERHSLRQILQSSGIALLAATVTGDAATVGTAVAGLPVILAQTSYSRGFETVADDFAFDLLRRNSISPAVFADFMERLDTDSELYEDLSFLSTHPVTSDRIERARGAGE
jgi:predicted Zn-dependent protease